MNTLRTAKSYIFRTQSAVIATFRFACYLLWTDNIRSFLNRISDKRQVEEPPAFYGGILADLMGLGKNVDDDRVDSFRYFDNELGCGPLGNSLFFFILQFYYISSTTSGPIAEHLFHNRDTNQTVTTSLGAKNCLDDVVVRRVGMVIQMLGGGGFRCPRTRWGCRWVSHHRDAAVRSPDQNGEF